MFRRGRSHRVMSVGRAGWYSNFAGLTSTAVNLHSRSLTVASYVSSPVSRLGHPSLGMEKSLNRGVYPERLDPCATGQTPICYDDFAKAMTFHLAYNIFSFYTWLSA